MAGFGPFDVMLDEERRGTIMEDLIDEFEPTQRQQAFAELAIACVDNGLLTRRSWIKHQNEHPEFERQPLMHSLEFVKWWNDAVFQGWLFRQLSAFELTEWEKTLMDAVFWEELALKVKGGNIDALKLYSKIRIEKQSGNGDMDALKDEVQAFLGNDQTDGFGTTIPEA